MTLTFHLKNWPKSNVNTAIKSQYQKSYVMAIVMYTLSVTIYDIFAIRNMHNLDVRACVRTHVRTHARKHARTHVRTHARAHKHTHMDTLRQ